LNNVHVILISSVNNTVPWNRNWCNFI